MKILKPILLLCCLFVVFNSCNGNKINSGRGTGGGGTGGGKPIVDLVVQQAWNDAKWEITSKKDLDPILRTLSAEAKAALLAEKDTKCNILLQHCLLQWGRAWNTSINLGLLNNLKLLINETPDVNHQNNEGNTMLHLLASQTYNPFEDVLALIKALKKKGAKIDITNNNGETPIQIVGTTFYLSKKKNPTQADQQKNAIKNALKRKKS